MDAKEQLEARRKSDRERFKRWKEKQAQAGKRHITAMISGEAYNIICQERDRTGNTTAEVIEQALLQKKPEPDRTTDRDTINSQAERIFELEARLKKLEGKKAPPNDEPDTIDHGNVPGNTK